MQNSYKQTSKHINKPIKIWAPLVIINEQKHPCSNLLTGMKIFCIFAYF